MKFLRTKWSCPLLLPGSIGLLLSLSTLCGSEKANDGADQRDDVDLAKVQAGGKIVLVSSGARGGGFRTIDDDHRTTFRFSTDDPRPTLIVQLVENRPIHRVSAVVGSKSEKIDVYLLNELPRKQSDLDDFKPIASIVDPGIAREASVDFAPQNARYVALRWTLSGATPEALNVAEVSAFGPSGSSTVSAELAATDPPMYLVSGPPIILPVSP
ncbi:MAG TPA: hypothetical protein VFA58_01715 [Chthoniobacterales bacterium]|nr:hypothetical protein [Chthoniobacterales bacterium]